MTQAQDALKVGQRQAFISEPKWVMRRLLIFLMTAWLAGLITYIAMVFAAQAAVAALLTLVIALVILMAGIQVVYLVAPSAEYLSKMAELVRAAKGDE